MNGIIIPMLSMLIAIIVFIVWGLSPVRDETDDEYYKRRHEYDKMIEKTLEQKKRREKGYEKYKKNREKEEAND